ncbi:MAG: GAF domain-containing protein [Acidimicrobiia bacterium]|nr:GAF domain-containing protein [Acidimicrobiia bacterium]
MTRALIEAGSPDETLQAIVDAVADALPADRVLVVTIDEPNRAVHDQIAGGPGGEMIVPVDYDDLMAGLTGWAIRTEQTIISPKGHPDTREGTSARQRRRETGGGSIVVVPLRFAGLTLGTMTVINRVDQDDFDEDAVRLAEAMANQAATAIAQSNLATSIHDHDATRDPARVTARFIEAMNQSDAASLVSLLAETAILSIPGRSVLAGEHMGRRAFLRVLKLMAESTEDSYNARIVDTYVSSRGAIVLVETAGERAGRNLDGRLSLRLTIINGRIVRAAAVPEDLYKFDEDWSAT